MCKIIYPLLILASVVVNLEFTRSAYIDSYNKPGFEVMLQSCKQISKITFEGEGVTRIYICKFLCVNISKIINCTRIFQIIPLIGKNLVTKSGNLLPVTIISRPVISMDIRLLLDEDLQNM